MKIKDGYILDSIGEQKVAIALDTSASGFSGIVKLNKVGAFLWELLLNEIDKKDLVNAVTEKYDVAYETAEKDVTAFLKVLEDNGILEN